MKPVGIHLPDDVREILIKQAKKNNRKPSNLAAHIIIEWARKASDEIPD